MITDLQKHLVLDWTKKVHILEYAHRFESKGMIREIYILEFLPFCLAV